MNLKHPLILGSSSPRRQFLMRTAGFQFTIEKPAVDEDFPADLPVGDVARYLALKKAEYFRTSIHHEIVVTADTVVILDNTILNKPADEAEAKSMLRSLSDKTHLVMTGVCILSAEKEESFDETTEVTFHKLSEKEIQHYIEQCQPFDKAGAYGAQECLPKDMDPRSTEEKAFLKTIGQGNLIREDGDGRTNDGVVAIQRIHGSYFNVMGLPIHKVYEHLLRFS
jgi:septum formation protein